MAVISIATGVSVPVYRNVQTRAVKESAQLAVVSMKSQCEASYTLGFVEEMPKVNVRNYRIQSTSNTCEKIQAIPNDPKRWPTYSYDMHAGTLTCDFAGAETSPFPECKKINAKDSIKQAAEENSRRLAQERAALVAQIQAEEEAETKEEALAKAKAEAKTEAALRVEILEKDLADYLAKKAADPCNPENIRKNSMVMTYPGGADGPKVAEFSEEKNKLVKSKLRGCPSPFKRDDLLNSKLTALAEAKSIAELETKTKAEEDAEALVKAQAEALAKAEAEALAKAEAEAEQESDQGGPCSMATDKKGYLLKIPESGCGCLMTGGIEGTPGRPGYKNYNHKSCSKEFPCDQYGQTILCKPGQFKKYQQKTGWGLPKQQRNELWQKLIKRTP